MDWTFIVLVLILIAIGNIGITLSNLVRTLQAKEMNTNNNNNVNLDTSDLVEQLKKIVKLMGGDKVFAEEEVNARRDLKDRLVKMLMYAQKKNERNSLKEASRLFKDAQEEEKHEDLPYKFTVIENWVKNMEKDEFNNSKYGHLLPKIREYLIGKETIDKDLVDVQTDLDTDYKGIHWLIERLLSEKRLKKVEDYHWDKPNELKYYEVLRV